jgi:prepilin-type N-terminal cleavage/methylation domain-containing protein
VRTRTGTGGVPPLGGRRSPVPQAGFTLIEVLVAMVVAVAAFSILAQGFTTGGRAAAASQAATRAAMLAQRVMTELEAGVIAADQSTSGVFADEPDCKYTTSSAADEPGLRLLTVTIRWKEQEQDRTFVLTRLLRERTRTP